MKAALPAETVTGETSLDSCGLSLPILQMFPKVCGPLHGIQPDYLRNACRLLGKIPIPRGMPSHLEDSFLHLLGHCLWLLPCDHKDWLERTRQLDRLGRERSQSHTQANVGSSWGFRRTATTTENDRVADCFDFLIAEKGAYNVVNFRILGKHRKNAIFGPGRN